MGDPLQPGFYPDPENTGLLRWWNGRGWTKQTRPATAQDAQPGAGPGFGPPAAFAQSGAPGRSGPPAGESGQAASAVPAYPGSPLPPVSQLARPVYVTAEARRRRRWPAFVGGGVGVVVLAAAAVAALTLTGVMRTPWWPPRRTAPARIVLGAAVVDHRAGLSYRVPAGKSWQPIPASTLGPWTLGYRALAQRGGEGTAGTVWAEVESAPLPSSYRYTGPQDLRSDGVQLADELATAQYPGMHTVEQLGVTPEGTAARGNARYVIRFAISFPAVKPRPGSVTRETADLVIAGRRTKQRPAVLLVTVPDTMDTTMVSRVALSAAAAGGNGQGGGYHGRN